MGKINYGRVILGGLLAGIVTDIIDWLVDGIWLGPRWANAMRALNHPAAFSLRQIVKFDLIGIACGILAVWIYAAIRPRFGAGMRTAVYAGVVTWALSTLLPNAALMYTTHLFGRGLTLYTTLGGFVEIVIGTIVGASLYKEAEAAPDARPVAAAETREAIRA